MPEAFGTSVDTSAMKDLARDFARAAPAAKRAAQAKLRETALAVLADAKARASFSAAISASGKVRMAGLNATVSMGGNSAWWAVPIENKGRGAVYHPTFGHAPITSLNSHPAFLLPAFEAKVEEYVEEVGDALVKATEAVLDGAQAMAARSVEVVFLGNADQYEAALEKMGVATDAATASIADKFGIAGANASTKFGDALDKGTSKIGNIFEKLGDELGQFGIPFSSNLTKIGQDLNNVETKGKGVVSAMTLIGGVGLAALAGVAAESVHLADGFDKAQAALKTAVTNSGVSWDTYSKQVSTATKTTGALVTGNSEDIDNALATLTTATNNPKEALKDLALAENMATLKHESLADASEQLSKILGGNTRVIQQWGVNLDIGSTKLNAIQKAEEALQSAQLNQKTVQGEVNDGQLQGIARSSALEKAQMSVRNATINLSEDQQSLGDVMDALNQRTKNAANNLGSTLAGQMTIARNSVHDLGVQFGEFLIPYIDKLLGYGAKLASFLLSNKDAALALAAAIGGPLVAAMGLAAGRGFLAIISDIGKLTIRFGNLATTALSKIPIIGTAFKTTGDQVDLATTKQISAMDLLTEDQIVSLATQENQWRQYAVEVQATSAQVLAATGQIDVALQRDASDAVAQAAIYGDALRSMGVSATQSAAIVEAQNAEMLASTEEASSGMIAALGATGVGLIMIGLGVAVTELMAHWKTAWSAMNDAATTAANGIINALNAVITAAQHVANAVIDVVDTFGAGISKIDAAGDTIGHKTIAGPGGTRQTEYAVNSTSGGFSRSTLLPMGTTSAQANEVQQLVNAGTAVASALQEMKAGLSTSQGLTLQSAVNATGLPASNLETILGITAGPLTPQESAEKAKYGSILSSIKTNPNTPGSTLTPLGATPTPTGGAPLTTITPGEALLEDAAKRLQGVATRAAAGGTNFSEQGATVQALTAATSAKNTAQATTYENALNATNNPTLVSLAESIESTWQTATTKLTNIIDSDTTAAQSKLQTLQSAAQATSLSTMTDAVDSSAKTSFNQLVTELVSTHQAALSSLAKQLESAWTAATQALKSIKGDLSIALQADAIQNTAALAQIATQQAQSFGQTVTQIGSSLANSIPSLTNYNPVPASLTLAETAAQTPSQIEAIGATQTPAQIEAAITASSATMLPSIMSAIGSATANPTAAGPDLGSLGTQAVVDNLNNAATAIKDAASVQTAQAQQQTTAITDAMNIASAAATAQTQQITDAAKLMSDAAAIMVNSINAQTTAANDTTNAMVQAIQDQTQTQVDTLGERGLYGLQLTAQIAKVALDQQVATDDANIAAAQANLDQVTAQTNQAVALAQQKSDADQAVNDAAIAAAQMSQLISQQANDAQVSQLSVAAAQAQQAEDAAVALVSQNNDTVQITSAIANAQAQASATQAAQQAQALTNEANQLQSQSQFLVGSAETQAQQQVSLLNAQAAAITQTATSIVGAIQQQTSAANQAASDALAQAEGAASQQNAAAQAALTAAQNAAAIQNAQQQAAVTAIQNQAAIQAAQDAAALSAAQSTASIQQALAQQQLSAIQNQAAITEAKLTSIYNVDQELANVEYSGSGVNVFITGVPMDNAAAISAAASYALRYQTS